MSRSANAKPLLEVTDLVRHYDLPREKLFGPPPTVKALNGVCLLYTSPSPRD